MSSFKHLLVVAHVKKYQYVIKKKPLSFHAVIYYALNDRCGLVRLKSWQVNFFFQIIYFKWKSNSCNF